MHGAAQASLDITSREAWGAMNLSVADNGDRIAVVAAECVICSQVGRRSSGWPGFPVA